MGALGVLNSWTEGICVHRIYYNKQNLKSAMVMSPPKSMKIAKLGSGLSRGFSPMSSDEQKQKFYLKVALMAFRSMKWRLSPVMAFSC